MVLQEPESEAGACCGTLGEGSPQGRLGQMDFTQLPRVPQLGMGRGEGEEVNPPLPPA